MGWYYDIIGYEKINPAETRDDKTISFLIGFIPPAGLGFNILDYCEDSEQYLEYDWYEENDTTGGKKVPSIFFDSCNMQNAQDIICIPWYLGLGYHSASSIRVDCPKMLFPKVDTSDIVFRVEYKVGPRYSFLGGKKVKYDVALRIEV